MSEKLANGRKAALQCLDALLADEHNIQALRHSLQEEFHEDPAKFFRTYAMPLTTKEQLIKLETPDKVAVRIELTSEEGPCSPPEDDDAE